MDNIYLFDKEDNLLEILDRNTLVSYDYLCKGSGSSEFSLDINKKNDNLKRYNKIGFLDSNNEFKLFVINDISNKYSLYENTVSITCLDDVTTLGNNLIRNKSIKNAAVDTALSTVLQDTRYKVGNIEQFNKHDLEFEMVSSLSGLNLILETYNCEFNTRIEIGTDGKISNKYIDMVYMVGTETGLRFTYDINLNSVEKTVLTDTHFNVLYGVGKEITSDEEGSESYNLTFKDIIWSKPANPTNKPFGREYVEDLESIEKYGRLEGVYENTEAEDGATLLSETYKKLQKVKDLKYSYSVDIENLLEFSGFEHYKYGFGDTIIVVDEESDIIISSRIVEVSTSAYFEGGEPQISTTLTLGDMRSGLVEDEKSEENIRDMIESVKDKINNISPEIEDTSFPDTLPQIPVLTGKSFFANISLDWTYESKVYYSYELYGSKTKDFNPGISNKIFEGQASSFTHEVNCDETWYYRVRAKNTHNQYTNYSEQIKVSTFKIEDGTDFFKSAAIQDALIGDLRLDRGWVGQLKGNKIDAKNLTVTDGNGKKTLDIDSFGRVYLDVSDMRINSSDVATCNWVKQEINPQYILTSVRKDSNYIEDISNPDNIILNSNFQNDIKNWNKHGQVYIDCNPSWMNYEHRMVYFHVNSDGLEECSNGVYQHFYTQIGQEYTVTFYAEADRMTPTNVYIGVEGVELVGLTNEENARYKRHLIRFIAEKETYAFIAYGGRETKFYLGNVMIQRGHMVRDWKASSRDTDLLVDTVNTLTEFKQTSEKFEFKIKNEGINNLVKNSSFENANGVITAKSGDVRNVLITKSVNEVILNDNFLYLQGEGIPGDVYVETNLHFIAEPGETYTISADTRFATLGAFASSSSYIKIGNDHFHIFESENFSYQWHRVYTTWTCPSNIGGTAYIRLGYRCADYSWGCYNNIKVEKGDVATPWCTANNEINEGITSIDENGVTVKHSNGASASFNYNGSVWRDAYDKEILRINGQGLEYISPDNGVWTAFMKSSKRTTNAENKGVSFSASGNGSYISMGCSKQTDPKASWEVSSGISMENYYFDGWWPGIHVWAMNTAAKDRTFFHNHTDYIQESGNIYMNGQMICFDTYGSDYPNWIGRTNTGRLGIFGNDNVVIGTRHGTTNNSAILITEGDQYDYIESWCPWDFHNYTLSNARMTYRSANTVSRSYSESTILKSQDESTRYIFENVEIKNNRRVLSIPNIYKGCRYRICSIVKKGNADVWISEEKETRFIIESSSDITVNIEIDIIEDDNVMAIVERSNVVLDSKNNEIKTLPAQSRE